MKNIDAIWKIIALDWRASPLFSRIFCFIMSPLIFVAGYFMSQLLVLPFAMWFAIATGLMPFQNEEKGALNNLFLTLPVTRKQIVAARYVNVLLWMLFYMALGLVAMPIVRHFSTSQWYIGFAGNLALAAVSLLLFAGFILAMFTFLFKYGYHKGKTLGIYVPSGIFMALIIFVYRLMHIITFNFMFEFILFATENMLLVSGGIIALSAGILYISYCLSLRSFAKLDV